MADESLARTWVDIFEDFVESAEWESRWDVPLQPEIEIWLALEMCRVDELSNGAENIFATAAKFIRDWTPLDEPDAPLPNVQKFIPISSEHAGLIEDAASITSELMELDGSEIVSFDVPAGEIDDSSYGFSNKTWVYDACMNTDWDKNISLIPYDDFEYLFQACLVNAKAINLTPELLSNVERILPRVREVLELNRFANPSDEHPHTAELIEKYMRSPWTFLRAIAAKSKLIKADQLEALASDVEPYVRIQIANNPQSPTVILESLACDELAEVRTEVAKNSSTPIEILRALSSDSENFVRLEVARNQAAPAEILETLLNDNAVYNGNYFVRQAVADHPNVTTNQLNILAADASDPGVRARAIANPQFPTERILDFFEDEHIAIQAKESYCSRLDGNPDIFREILKATGDELETYQRALAANRATPIDILKALALTQNHWVTWNLKFNPSITEEIKATLALLEEKH